MELRIDRDEGLRLLDRLYDQSVRGIPKVSPPACMLSEEYLCQCAAAKAAAKKFINYQIINCTTSGFLAGLGELIDLPAGIPANVGSLLYVQMQTIVCLAYMGGFDTDDDQSRALVYGCLAGGATDGSIGEAFEPAETAAIAERAYKMFIEGDMSLPDKDGSLRRS